MNLSILVLINVGRERGIALVRRQSEPNIKNTLTWLYSGSFLERNGRVEVIKKNLREGSKSAQYLCHVVNRMQWFGGLHLDPARCEKGNHRLVA
jgi:hypothetical protein